jgi:drug/metabolite transporter (DMT)-like permease
MMGTLGWIFVFSSSSIAMTVLNKELASMNLYLPLILAIQASMACGVAPCIEVPFFCSKWKTWIITVPVIVCTVLTTSIYALQTTSIGSMVIARNTIPIVTMFIEWYTLSRDLTGVHVVSGFIILGGSIMYESFNINASLPGLFYLAVNVIASSVDRIVEKQLIHELDSNTSARVVMNNIIGVVLLAVLSVWCFVWYPRRLSHILHPRIITILVVTGFGGTILNYAGMEVQQRMPASSMTILGCVIRLTIIVLGILYFEETLDVWKLCGIIVSFAGCLVYAFANNVNAVLDKIRIIVGNTCIFKPWDCGSLQTT